MGRKARAVNTNFLKSSKAAAGRSDPMMLDFGPKILGKKKKKYHAFVPADPRQPSRRRPKGRPEQAESFFGMVPAAATLPPSSSLVPGGRSDTNLYAEPLSASPSPALSSPAGSVHADEEEEQAVRASSSIAISMMTTPRPDPEPHLSVQDMALAAIPPGYGVLLLSEKTLAQLQPEEALEVFRHPGTVVLMPQEGFKAPEWDLGVRLGTAIQSRHPRVDRLVVEFPQFQPSGFWVDPRTDGGLPTILPGMSNSIYAPSSWEDNQPHLSEADQREHERLFPCPLSPTTTTTTTSDATSEEEEAADAADAIDPSPPSAILTERFRSVIDLI